MELIKALIEFIKIAITGIGGGLIELITADSLLPFLGGCAVIASTALIFIFINKMK